MRERDRCATSVAARVRAHDMENNKAEHDRCPSAAERKKDIHPIGAEELYQKTLTKIVIAASANTDTSATGFAVERVRRQDASRVLLSVRWCDHCQRRHDAGGSYSNN